MEQADKLAKTTLRAVLSNQSSMNVLRQKVSAVLHASLCKLARESQIEEGDS